MSEPLADPYVSSGQTDHQIPTVRSSRERCACDLTETENNEGYTR